MIAQEELVNALAKKENRDITRKICNIKKSRQLFLEVSNTGAYERFIELKLEKIEEEEKEEIASKIKKRL